MTDLQPPEASVNFEQLPLARAEFPSMPAGQYRVYSDQKNFKLVQAISAVGALEASGWPKAFKIEREDMHKNALLTPNFGTQEPKEPLADSPAP